MRLFNGNCEEWLDCGVRGVDCVFMDPPDNLGLKYDGYTDKRSDYYPWLASLIRKSMYCASTVWVSYYWRHDLELSHQVRNILHFERPSWGFKKILWTYTFGQYNDNDFGSCYRVLLRLRAPGVVTQTDDIRIESARMEQGDARAAGLRVPGDIWEEPRVVGNSRERRPWHPTQHPEALYRRVVDSSVKPGGTIVDLFAGTGTLFRAIGPNYRRFACEQSEAYCGFIQADHPALTVVRDPRELIA